MCVWGLEYRNLYLYKMLENYKIAFKSVVIYHMEAYMNKTFKTKNV